MTSLYYVLILLTSCLGCVCLGGSCEVSLSASPLPRRGLWRVKYKEKCGLVTLRYAVIADIVGSRTLTNRPDAQRTFEETFEKASQGLTLLEAPYATVGDEFQAVANSLEDALLLTLRSQLLLPAQLQLRFGIGAGRIEELPGGVHGHPRPRAADVASLQDGSAWWAARAAINRAHQVQDSSNPFIRTWFIADSSVEATISPNYQTCVNALLSLRDHAILKLSARHRRITASLLLGKTQVEIARVEKLSQQAISDFARGSGAGLIQSSLIIAEAARA